MPTATPAHFDVDVSFGSPSFALVAKPAKFDVDVTFGAPGFARAIKPLHFNVNTAFQSVTVFTVSTLRPFVFLIAGVDRTTNVLQSESVVNIAHKLGAISTADITTMSVDGTYRPTRGQDLVIVESSTGERLFGGFIQITSEDGPPGTDAVRVQCSAVGYGARFEKRFVGAWITALPIIFSPGTMLLEILREFTLGTGLSLGPGGDGGSVITEDRLFPWVNGLQALRLLADPDGLDTWVDQYGGVYFIDRATGSAPAPFNIADNDGNVDAEGGGPRVRRDGTRYANRVLIRPDTREPGMWTDTYAGDEGIGGGNFYLTKYAMARPGPIVKVNGDVMIVGEYALSAGVSDFTYAPDGQGVVSTASYGPADLIEISYPIPLQPVYTAQDDAEIAAHGSIVEALIDVKDVTDPALLQLLADGWLARLKVEPYLVEYPTSRTGLKPGQLQNVNLSRPLVPNVDVLIDSISGTFEPTNDGGFFRWRVTATNAQVQGERDFTRMVQRMQAAITQPQDRHRVTVTFDIAADPYPGYTENEGAIQTGKLPLDRQLDKPGYLKEVRVRFERDGTQVDTAQIDVRVNGTTVFANGEYLEYSPDVTSGDTVKKYNFSAVPYRGEIGDLVTVWLITGDAALMNGKGEIEIQG